ncbi:hypothetical protein CKM354_000494000 [Cercospora kikuchii]|uniref:Uncharacterized protein n=1 Tax=Cercospora kikuchii TaxID=84275 RepID=A0A9P3FBU3_9PEZI|nr:uncharacterized protein CKM354_000494000 [Cercospora kikuchii]GIZ41641.1 hypothetical protein CKM354_000494000 [Cercospora kikuchii]
MFGRTEKFDASQPRTPDLTHPVHPLFEDLEELHHGPLMVCRLASLLLEKALAFFHAILVVGDSLPNCTGGVEHFCPEPKASLTTDEQEQTRKMLAELATGVTIYTGFPPNWDVDPALLGQTCPDYNVEFPQLRGRGSTIFLNSDRIKALYRAAKSNDHAAFFWYTLQLAKTMVHEVAHAAALSTMSCTFAVESREVYDNMFIGLSQFTEHGLDLENFLFGGVVNKIAPWKREAFYFDGDKPSSLDFMITLGDYPDPLTEDLYLYCKHRGPPLADVVTEWHVSLSWVHQLLLQSFWDSALKGDNSALHPPRTSGIILGRLRNPESMKAVESRIEELRAAGVYNVTDFGYISLDPIVGPPKTGIAASAIRKVKDLSRWMFHEPMVWGPLDNSWY